MIHSIVEAVSLTAKQYPTRLAIITETAEYTYQTFWNMIMQARDFLMQKGIGKECCVMAECTQDAEYTALALSCGLVGAYFVPIEHKSAPKRVEEIAEEVQAALLVTSQIHTEVCETVAYSELYEMQINVQKDIILPQGEEIAEILFTTGTTGKSKGIMITHHNNIALAQNIAHGVQMKEGNIELIPIPINHAHGLRTLYANMYMGGTVILVDGVMKVKKIYDLIAQYKATAIDLTPMAASALLKLSKGRFSAFAEQLDYIELGAAALTQEVKEKIRETFPGVRLYNAYGSSESGRTCMQEFSQHDEPFCIGSPVPNAEFVIVDEEHRPIESSRMHTGLLACKGPMNMKGYWKNQELTDTVLQDGFVYTNDEGYIKNGLIYLIGRMGDVINYRGIKIAPEEVEEAAMHYPGVLDCCCVPKKDKHAGQVPRLFLKMENPDSFDKKAFLTMMSEHLDSNKMPADIIFIDEIPRAYNGKLQRKKLIEG